MYFANLRDLTNNIGGDLHKTAHHANHYNAMPPHRICFGIISSSRVYVSIMTLLENIVYGVTLIENVHQNKSDEPHLNCSHKLHGNLLCTLHNWDFLFSSIGGII